MAKAIIGGLIASGYPATNIYVSEPIAELGAKLNATYGVHTTTDNNTALSFSSASQPADVVIVAVKPQVLKGVAEGIAASAQKYKPLFITIVAGIRVADLARWLSSDPTTHALLPGAKDPSIVRVMPNTPALVQEGASGLWAPEGVTDQQKTLAGEIMNAFSKKAFWLEKEFLLDVVTGVSGSGPAYFFYMLEAMEHAAIELGMPKEIARGLAAQTCLGAGKMALADLEDPAILRKNVTSPKGTTEAAIKVFDDKGGKDIMKAAVIAATKRADELANILGAQGSSTGKL
ncbi:hypothetical protein HDV05_000906 [Chytridiales sp. JEL 0842]|nr:hypothetical protein HDV05_000906 [Chytridiales sp. JEL 0842]